MKNTSLLNETLDLLNEIKFKQGNTDNCISKSLEKAIKNLEEIQDEDSNKILATVLKVLGKLVNNLPEIKKLLDYLAGL